MTMKNAKTTPSQYVRVSFLAYFPITESVGASRWFETNVLRDPIPAVMREDAAAQLRAIYGDDANFEIQLFRVL